jgi:outer membrane protein
MSNTKTLIALAAAALLPTFASAASTDDSGDWIVRARGVYLQSANKDSTGLNLSINDKLLPEVDISYFFTPNFATELVLTYPQRQTLSSNGAAIGTLKHLPPVLSAQYHFTGMQGFRPYLGAGVNYTHFSDASLPAGVSISSNSFGLAVQAGFDVPLGGGWLFNTDIKKVQIATDVSAAGVKIGTLKVDPWLFAIGVGKRF